MQEVDLIILGGGFAGLSAARVAAEYNARAVLIEENQLGGTGFHQGPYILREVLKQDSKLFNSGDWPSIKSAAKNLGESLSKKWGDELTHSGIQIIQARGAITGPNLVSLDSDPDEIYRGKALIVATGSEHVQEDSIPYDGQTIFGSDSILDWDTLPGSILIVGEGPRAVELAQLMQFAGVRVFLCGGEPRILPGQDPDLIEVAESVLKQNKAKVLLPKKIKSIFKSDGQIQVTLDGGVQFTVDRVVFCGERKVVQLPFVPESNAPDRGVHGELWVNEKMATAVNGTYAAGSVTGHAHDSIRSQEEGRVAATNALGKKRTFRPEVIPHVVSIDPEIASVGSSKEMAHHFGFRGVEGRCELSEKENVGSAFSCGFKLVADRDTKSIIGGQAWGEGAATLISIVQLAIRKGLSPKDLVQMPAPIEGPMARLQKAAHRCLQALGQRL